MAPSIRVLHVDDDPQFGELVAELLERADDRIEVVTETGAEDGLATLDRERVDAVVSDYDMPGTDGLEFLAAVREEYPDLPFVLFTGKGSEEVASEAIGAGATDYLRKGTGTEQYELLVNRVRNAVEQHRSAREAETMRRRLRELAESTTDCLWLFDRDWEELLFVSGYEEVWGRPTEAIEENPLDFLEAVVPEHRDRIRRGMDRLSNGESVDDEYRIRRGEDDYGWVWVKGQPVFEDGEVVRVVGFSRDVTDRTERERELERYERIVENLPVGVFRTTAEGEFVSMNDRYASLLGADSPAELRENEAWDLWADPDARSDLLDRLGAEGVVEEEPVRLRTVDGDSRWIETTLRVTEEDGDRYLDGIVQDVTDRRRRTRRLERAETTFEHAQDAFFLVDVETDGAEGDGDGPTFRFQRVNPAHEDATGLPPEEVVGRTPREVFGEENGANLAARYRECVRRRQPLEYEETLTLDGERTFWETRIAPVVIDGEVERIVGATRNITEHRERERELERYETILETADDVAFVVGTDWTMEYVNRSVEDYLDATVEEIQGRSVEDLAEEYVADSDDPRRFEAALERAFDAGAEYDRPERLELTLDVASGEVTFEYQFSPLVEDGETTGVVVTMRDVTERKRRERRLRRQNERFDELASAVSHDLQTPLETARGRARLAIETGDLDHVDRVLSALDRVDDMRSELAEVLRTRDLGGETEPTDPGALAREVWTTVDPPDGTSLAVDGSPRVEANPDALRRLLENLFTNAVEHGGDCVTVRVGDLDGGFYVEDDGEGIPPGHREDVFTPGYSTKPGGTGMGMASVRQIVLAHDWRIRVTDGPDGGARFEVLTDP